MFGGEPKGSCTSIHPRTTFRSGRMLAHMFRRQTSAVDLSSARFCRTGILLATGTRNQSRRRKKAMSWTIRARRSTWRRLSGTARASRRRRSSRGYWWEASTSQCAFRIEIDKHFGTAPIVDQPSETEFISTLEASEILSGIGRSTSLSSGNRFRGVSSVLF